MFRKNRRKCLDCERADGRRYRKSVIGKAKSKKWVEENREKMRQLQSDWHQRNKEKINAKFRERYNNEPEFKLKKNVQRRIQYCLHGEKKDRTMNYLGTTLDKFKEWLQFNFDDNMTFENYGLYWHMDHVIPVDTFDMTKDEDVYICFNWRNISPMKGPENISKHNKIIKSQIETHLINLKIFNKKNKEKIPHKFEQLFAKYLI